MQNNIVLIEGDGIGPEITAAAVAVVEASGASVKWHRHAMGLATLAQQGTALPQSTVAAVRQYKVALKGPTTTPIGDGHVSANVQLRQQLDLYASIRPLQGLAFGGAMPPLLATRSADVSNEQNTYDAPLAPWPQDAQTSKAPSEPTRWVVVRENTEGLYKGLEMTVAPGVNVALKVVTERGCRRIAHAAFAYAQRHGRRRVTVGHKANILKQNDGMFLRYAQEVAREYPEIECTDCLIDALCMRLVMDPSQFDVLLLPNLYGDIVSDLCAGLVGGLGLVPGINLGDNAAVFEAVHGSAPDIAGRNQANPLALIRCAVLLLRHIEQNKAAQRIEQAVRHVLQQEKIRTRDLGGSASTTAFAHAIVKALGAFACRTL